MLTSNPTHEILGFLPIIKYKMKKALIFGVSGQDGAYLAKLLLGKGYTVYGTSRDAQVSTFRNLEYLGIHQQVQLESAALNDFRSVLQVLKKTQPDEVYNLAGQTSVGLSFEQPVERLRMYCGGDAEYFGGDAVQWGAD
jgi:GDPmannose 4,6-dehydratase